MSYQLRILENEDDTKKFGENIFLDDIPFDSEVYLFYYPGIALNKELENKLEKLGDITDNNLFVNIGRLNDKNYKKIVKKFDIRDLPVIIVTAIDNLASPSEKFETMYVKIINKELLNSPDLVIECLQKVFNLFIQGEISKAINQVEKYERDIFISHLNDIITNAIIGVSKKLGGFFDKRDIIVSIVPLRFEIKKSGGD